jgi:hypothetical protein
MRERPSDNQRWNGAGWGPDRASRVSHAIRPEASEFLPQIPRGEGREPRLLVEKMPSNGPPGP